MTGPLPTPLRALLIFGRQLMNPRFAAGVVYSAVARLRLRRAGPGLRLPATTVIQYGRNIEIGRNFTAMGFLYLYVQKDGAIRIGDNCDVNTNVQFGAGSGTIVVGDDVMIAANVVMRAGNHGMARGCVMKDQRSTAGAIFIEDDVWIGSNCVITTDVTIARGTVVAAGAVVTRSTEPYSIVAGVPARKIGERL